MFPKGVDHSRAVFKDRMKYNEMYKTNTTI